ncbi:farnesol dehydrogenase-like [Diorhabda sublineata]|uniref:farnesol dehydrogenase-like n=1 Tax=Diorhabda sublineata TaxID=1163346 RepID=UPI0024E0E5C8|nr:farnesol dehydrogenase-like [Diorhabda sublineata]
MYGAHELIWQSRSFKSIVNMNRWSGKVAVVTGASAGIGASVAEKLLQEGLNVVGIARRKDRILESVKNSGEQNGKLYAVQADLTKQEEIIQVFDWINKNVGPVSILVNNAGIVRKTNLVNGDIEGWKKILDTNVLAVAIASREAIKSMQENKIDGHIININSMATNQVPKIPYNNVYPPSKFAVTALSETLRNELITIGSKIKVSSINPGYTRPDLIEVNGIPEFQLVRQLLEMVPSLKAEDIANAVVYVLGTPPMVQVTELTVMPLGESMINIRDILNYRRKFR